MATNNGTKHFFLVEMVCGIVYYDRIYQSFNLSATQRHLEYLTQTSPGAQYTAHSCQAGCICAIVACIVYFLRVTLTGRRCKTTRDEPQLSFLPILKMPVRTCLVCPCKTLMGNVVAYTGHPAYTLLVRVSSSLGTTVTVQR